MTLEVISEKAFLLDM